jgi:DNA polymerase-1
VYQSGREFDDELPDQSEILPEFVAACGFKSAKAHGYEADDFLAAAVAGVKQRRGTTLVAGGDRDGFQLASETTTILYPVRARGWPESGRQRCATDNGVKPDQVPDFIALRGDPSDKLPGARGVEPKGAPDLWKRYGTLDAILAAGRFPTQADDLRLFRSFATMDRAAPLPSLAAQKPTWSKAARLASTRGLNQLADRLTRLQSA